MSRRICDSVVGATMVHRKAYQLTDSFPRNLLLTRTDSERKNHIYLVSAAVREVLQSPELKRLRVRYVPPSVVGLNHN